MRKQSHLFRKVLKTLMGVFLAGLLLWTAVYGSEAGDRRKQEERLQTSGDVINEVLNMPDNIPQSLLDRAKCVVVIPSVLKAAFIVGGTYGRGAMVCRSGEGFTGQWGAPVMMAVEGGSVGLQLGGEATDFVILIMNDRGASSLLSSKVKIGGDISAAAGPVGRTAEADTDAYMRAEMLTYSRARGLFAGISLEGTTLRPEAEADEALYGRKIEAREIVRGPDPKAPEAASRLISRLDQASPIRKGE
jgi:SH3 domain-containing YSC84-like protein 1